jgi:hypothetical protein
MRQEGCAEGCGRVISGMRQFLGESVLARGIRGVALHASVSRTIHDAGMMGERRGGAYS